MKKNWRRLIRMATWVVPIFSLLVVSIAAENATPEIKVLADDKRPIKLASNDGAIDGELRIMRLGTKFTGGGAGESVVFIVRDPKSGMYLWTHQWLEPKAPSYRRDHGQAFVAKRRFYMTNEKIVGFHLNGFDLIVNENGGKAREPQTAGDDVIKTLKARIDKVYANPSQFSLAVPLRKSLGTSFFMGSKLTANLRESKLLDISRAGVEWTVTVEGPDGEHATVLLSNDYKILKAERSGKALFPDDDKKSQ